MNREAERHLAKAKDYIAKGGEFYRKAKSEIDAALAEGASLREVSRYLDMSKDWVADVRDWDGTGTLYAKDTASRQVRQAKQVFRDAPLEQVEQIVAALPFERQQAIAAATGNRYAKARQDHDEKERRMTPAERKEREAGTAETRTLVAKTMAGFDTFGIVNLLEQATTILGEMIGSDTVDAGGMAKVDAALAAFLDEYRVAAAMVNMTVDA